MNSPTIPRRRFLQSAMLAAAASSAAPAGRMAPAATAARPVSPPPAGNSLRIACIGVGNRGYASLGGCLPHATITALCDVDDLMMAEALVRAADQGRADLLKVPRFKDYREMFAKAADTFDAVTVATPDHHHYPAAMLALKHRKHLYVEKPLTHSVAEARALREAARTAGVVTQMGNQGHTTEGIRLVREWFELGLVGEVREVVGWGPGLGGRYFYRPGVIPPPPGGAPPNLDWDLWLGPAPKRDFAPVYQPEMWRGWWDFGSAMLGDWACHTLDAPYWALQLGGPTRVDVKVEGWNAEIVPDSAVVTFHFPARGALPPVKLTWCEGRAVMPPRPAQWDVPQAFPNRGMMMIGSKGTLFHGGRPDSPMLLPGAAMEAIKADRPKKWIPRVKGGPIGEWLTAIKEGGPAPGSSFEYAAGLSQMALLGAVAMRTGKGFDWDEARGRITSDPELNRFIEIRAREGWQV